MVFSGVAVSGAEDGSVSVLSGCVGAGAGDCNAAGIDAFFPILREVCEPEAALDRDYAAKNLADTAEQVFRLICAV